MTTELDTTIQMVSLTKAVRYLKFIEAPQAAIDEYREIVAMGIDGAIALYVVIRNHKLEVVGWQQFYAYLDAMEFYERQIRRRYEK